MLARAADLHDGPISSLMLVQEASQMACSHRLDNSTIITGPGFLFQHGHVVSDKLIAAGTQGIAQPLGLGLWQQLWCEKAQALNPNLRGKPCYQILFRNLSVPNKQLVRPSVEICKRIKDEVSTKILGPASTLGTVLWANLGRRCTQNRNAARRSQPSFHA